MTIETRKESRWNRPNLYLTIVSTYLLCSLAIVLSLSLYYYYNWIESLKHADVDAPGWAMVPVFAIGFLFILVIVALPTIIGPVLLFRKQKSGVYVSLVALVLMTFSLPLSIGLFHMITTNASTTYMPVEYVLFYSAMASAIVMYPLLLVKRNKVKWQ
jgi:hypothetical protein